MLRQNKNLSWYLLRAYSEPGSVKSITHIHSILRIMVWNRCHYYLHFTEEAQRSYFTVLSHTANMCQSWDLNQFSLIAKYSSVKERSTQSLEKNESWLGKMSTLYCRVEKQSRIQIINNACNFWSAFVVKIMYTYMHRPKTRMMHITASIGSHWLVGLQVVWIFDNDRIQPL